MTTILNNIKDVIYSRFDVIFNNSIVASHSKGQTILSVAKSSGVELTGFCVHNTLPIAGNCRVCLVRVGNGMKPLASCATEIAPNMVVDTTGDFTIRARESSLAHLLRNHPLDCPVCDEAGNCDLQDYALEYGTDRGRYVDVKRAFENSGMLTEIVHTNMNRCIHCTRCIRFIEKDIGAVYGTLGRGEATAVSTYLRRVISKTIFSGSLINLCPVGALTSGRAAFSTRAWETRQVTVPNLFDSDGGDVILQLSPDNRVVGVEPATEGALITDSARQAYELMGSHKDRIYSHGTLDSKGNFVKSTWEEVVENVRNNLRINNRHLLRVQNVAVDEAQDIMRALWDLDIPVFAVRPICANHQFDEYANVAASLGTGLGALAEQFNASSPKFAVFITVDIAERSPRVLAYLKELSLAGVHCYTSSKELQSKLCPYICLTYSLAVDLPEDVARWLVIRGPIPERVRIKTALYPLTGQITYLDCEDAPGAQSVTLIIGSHNIPTRNYFLKDKEDIYLSHTLVPVDRKGVGEDRSVTVLARPSPLENVDRWFPCVRIGAGANNNQQFAASLRLRTRPISTQSELRSGSDMIIDLVTQLWDGSKKRFIPRQYTPRRRTPRGGDEE